MEVAHKLHNPYVASSATLLPNKSIELQFAAGLAFGREYKMFPSGMSPCETNAGGPLLQGFMHNPLNVQDASKTKTQG